MKMMHSRLECENQQSNCPGSSQICTVTSSACFNIEVHRTLLISDVIPCKRALCTRICFLPDLGGIDRIKESAILTKVDAVDRIATQKECNPIEAEDQSCILYHDIA